VAISANAMSGDVKKGMEVGFFRYLTKPINVVELMGALNAALKASVDVSGMPKMHEGLRFQ
jgi:CheY-like chemotaxis protein